MSRPPQLLGLHHVTATADAAQPDLDFFAGVLGLRLVKRTVNFDNHNVYHFYYGNRTGAPGTIWTTFPYHGWGVPAGAKGAGQIHTTSFSVPKGSLGFWRARLEERRVGVRDAPPRFGEEAIECVDPSGLVIALVATDRDARAPWTSIEANVDSAAAVRGLHGVTLIERNFGPTMEFMTSVLGFRVAGETPGRVRMALSAGAPGQTMDLVLDPSAPPARNGLGTVHHVAMAIATDEEQAALRDQLLALAVHVTDIRDRQYFQSIYFREPGGVLFEVATAGPGFLIDEDESRLGEGLKLPPWEEQHRPEIEAGLPPIVLR